MALQSILISFSLLLCTESIKLHVVMVGLAFDKDSFDRSTFSARLKSVSLGFYAL